MKKVVVIGGGLAGLSGATVLAEKGYLVTLAEKRAILGGRASSTINPETGQSIDNCQHVLLGCCTELLNFYQRLGVDSKITFQDEYLFIDPKGEKSILKSSCLPAPLHLLPSFFKLKFLKFPDKMAILYAMTAMALTPAKSLQHLEKEPFIEWLRKHFQTQGAIDRFWRIILVSALNEDIEKLSTKYAFKTFREAFLKNKTGYRMGVPNAPLSKLYSDPAIKYLEQRGGKILFQKKLLRLEIKNNKVVRALFSDGSELVSDVYMLALPFYELIEALPPEIFSQYPFFQKIKSLETSPITGIHLFFDRPIMEEDSAIFLNRKIQWIFNKTKNFILENPKNQYLQIVISASRDLISMSKTEVVDLIQKELEEVFPQAHQARLLKAIVIKELHATFSPQPGSDAFRIPQKTPLDNLFIAGDWTWTDWPATMESAVRSGLLAAEAVLATESRP